MIYSITPYLGDRILAFTIVAAVLVVSLVAAFRPERCDCHHCQIRRRLNK